MSHDPRQYYTLLRLSADAEPEAVKLSYRALAKHWHPDHNADPAALEIFQQLSVAYDVLSDERKRLIYDLLSLVYQENDFPEVETMEPYKDNQGAPRPDIRAVSLTEVRALPWKYKENKRTVYGTESQLLRLEFKSSVMNWLLGWWHPAAALKNFKALIANFTDIHNRRENFRLLVHNAVAYWQSGQNRAAAQSAVLALRYAGKAEQWPLRRLLAKLNLKVSRPRRWNFWLLRLVQLSFPMLLIAVLLLPPLLGNIKNLGFEGWLSEKTGIDYFQTVRFKNRGNTVDDIVVGKILSIPVDRSNLSRLYHLKSTQNLMYGPSENFDVLKKVPADITVRLTGVSPDNAWARVMIDNGEMGFVRMEHLVKGIGKPIPDFSRVYEP